MFWQKQFVHTHSSVYGRLQSTQSFIWFIAFYPIPEPLILDPANLKYFVSGFNVQMNWRQVLTLSFCPQLPSWAPPVLDHPPQCWNPLDKVGHTASSESKHGIQASANLWFETVVNYSVKLMYTVVIGVIGVR